MKNLFLLGLVLVSLTGCISSSHLASIGAKAKHGTTTIENENITISLLDSERNVGSYAFWHGAFFPFTNLYPDKEGENFAKVTFHYSDISWDAAKTNGTVVLDVNGIDHVFDVHKNSSEITLTSNYREWYSYPAQIFQIVTLPLDLVITSIGGVVMIVAIPFVED